MDHAPLPPHERAWRHPSELAEADRVAAASEAPTALARTLAMAGGTTGVLLIGLGLLALTPGGSNAPAAVSATTTPRVAGIAPVLLTGPSTHGPIEVAAATPIGDGTLAVMTHQSLTGRLAATDGADVVVDTGSGLAVVVSVVDLGSDDDLALVELRPTDEQMPVGFEVAERVPDDDEMVTVLADPPVDVKFAEVDELEVADGTAVVDGSGALIGLCTDGLDDATGTEVIAVEPAVSLVVDDDATTAPD